MIVVMMVLLCIVFYLFWKNNNSIIITSHGVKQVSVVHTTGSLYFDEIYLCSDEEGDIELYKKLKQQWKKCNNDFPTTITCDIQCTDITGISHHYTIPERNLSFDLQYDHRTSAYDFLQDTPSYYLFVLSWNILTEDILYDTSLSPKNTIVYNHLDISYDKLLKNLQSQWYIIEDYTKQMNSTDNNIIAYWVSGRSIMKNTTPDERIYVFHKMIPWYFYNVSKDILSYDCNPWPCSSLSNIAFFK